MLCSSSFAQAQDESRPLVHRVTLTGNRVISATTLQGKIQTQEGQPFSQLIMNEDIKRLYQTGFFSDVKATVRDVTGGIEVVFTLQEKTLYDTIEWQGANALKPPKLQKLIPLQRGEFLDERKLKLGMTAIRAEYEKKGFPNTLVEYTVRTNPATGESTVYVLVDEGGKVKITQIRVAGNARVGAGRIRHAMKTKRWHWFRSGKYEQTVLQEDAERVAALYRNLGYQDAAVTTATALDASGRRMTVTVTVDEGPLYRVEAIVLAGNVLFPEKEIRNAFQLTVGAPYSTERLQADTRSIQSFYFDRGYIFAQVTPEPSVNPQTRQVRITYRLKESELGYIDRVDIRKIQRCSSAGATRLDIAIVRLDSPDACRCP